VGISNEPAASALGVTTERDGWGQLIVAVGDIHTAESFPDSLASKEQCPTCVGSRFGYHPSRASRTPGSLQEHHLALSG